MPREIVLHTGRTITEYCKTTKYLCGHSTQWWKCSHVHEDTVAEVSRDCPMCVRTKLEILGEKVYLAWLKSLNAETSEAVETYLREFWS